MTLPSGLLLAATLSAVSGPLNLPSPFRNATAEDVMSALYPGWDLTTHRLATERASKIHGRPRLVESAELWEVDVWEEKEEHTHLVALVSTWKEETKEKEEDMLCDLALLDMEAGKLAVKALLQDAVRCGGGVTPTLELRSRQASGQPAFGIRLERSTERATEVSLSLFSLDRGALRPLRVLTIETVVRETWKRLGGPVTRGHEVQLKASTAQVPRARLSDHRPLRDAPLGALLCRVAGSPQVEVGIWPADATDHAELALAVTADRDGTLECRLNDDAPPEGAYVEVQPE